MRVRVCVTVQYGYPGMQQQQANAADASDMVVIPKSTLIALLSASQAHSGVSGPSVASVAAPLMMGPSPYGEVSAQRLNGANWHWCALPDAMYSFC